MTRFRWFEVEDISPKEFTFLREAISDNQYNANSTSGFKIQSSNAKQVVARFVKRFEYTERVQDPFGKVFEIPVFGFDAIDFRLYSSSPKLEILNSPSPAVDLLISQLSDYLPQMRSISEAVVEPIKWLNSLSPNFDSFEVRAMSVTDVPVTNSISAKVGFEGVEDVRSGVAKLLGSRNHVVQKLKLEARFSGGVVKLDLCADGKASLSSENEKLGEFLREALGDARKRQNK